MKVYFIIVTFLCLVCASCTYQKMTTYDFVYKTIKKNPLEGKRVAVITKERVTRGVVRGITPVIPRNYRCEYGKTTVEDLFFRQLKNQQNRLKIIVENSELIDLYYSNSLERDSLLNDLFDNFQIDYIISIEIDAGYNYDLKYQYDPITSMDVSDEYNCTLESNLLLSFFEKHSSFGNEYYKQHFILDVSRNMKCCEENRAKYLSGKSKCVEKIVNYTFDQFAKSYEYQDNWKRSKYYSNYKNNFELKRAKNCVDNKLYLEAEEIWKRVVKENPNPNVVARALYNLSFFEEVLGDTLEAKKYAIESWENYNFRPAKQRLNQLSSLEN